MLSCFQLGCGNSAEMDAFYSTRLCVEFFFRDWHGNDNTARITVRFCSPDCEKRFLKGNKNSLCILQTIIDAHSFWLKKRQSSFNLSDFSAPVLNIPQSDHSRCSIKMSIPTAGKIGVSQATISLHFSSLDERMALIDQCHTQVELLLYLKENLLLSQEVPVLQKK